MSGSAERLLDLLAERKLLPQFTIDSLRRQVRDAEAELTAHQIARLLQRKGKITAFQARELLAEVEERSSGGEARPASRAVEPAEATSADDDLSLAPDEEDERQDRRYGKTASPAQSKAEQTKSKAASETAVQQDDSPAIPAGLDDLLDDPLVAADAAAANPLMPPPKQKKGWFGGKRSPSYAKRSRVGWDSPLIIVGGGILLLLVLIGGALAFVLTRGSGDNLFNAAEQDYLDGNYAQSVGNYEKFIARHGGHPKASQARVRMALARIRSSTSRGDWPQALAAANKVLPGIENETALGDARPEVAGLLTDIVAGLADQAAQAPDDEQAAQRVSLFREAAELAQRPVYSPGEVRQAQSTRLDSAQEKIDVVVRNLEQSAELSEDIAAMNAAVDDGEIARAYQIHADLIRLYPRLEHDPQLQSAVRAITAKLAKLVRVSDDVLDAKTDDHPTPLAADVALGSPQGDALQGVDGYFVPLVIDGVLYVLSAKDGKLLWRRFIGGDSESVFAMSDRPGADLLVADAERQELLRLSATDGKLVWRLPVGERFVFSPPSDDTIYVTVLAGRVIVVDGKTGSSKRQIQFPQRLAAGVAVDAQDDALVQMGEHANAYVLDRSSLACRAVHYLGHKAGTYQQTPIAAFGLLVAPHNVGLARSQLHVIRFAGDTTADAVQSSTVPLPGRIATELLVGERRVITVNDRGAIRVFGMDLADKEKPLELVGETTGDLQGDAVFAALADNTLILADRRLTAFNLPAADGPPTARWVKHNGDRFIVAPRVIGSYVFHARRREGEAGVTVAAAEYDPPRAAKAGEPIWQTVIAAGSPDQSLRASPDGASITAYCASGSIFTINVDGLGSTVNNAPITRPELPGRFEACLELTDSRNLLVARDGIRRLLIDDANSVPRFTEARSDPSLPPLAAQPTPWHGGLLLPLAAGRVEFWTERSAPTPIYPFQPKLVVGEHFRWLPPLAIDDSRALLARDDGHIYIVQIENQGATHLAATTEAMLGQPLIGQPVVLGEKAIVVGRDDKGDFLRTIELPQMKSAAPIRLVGRLRWGPHTLGELILLATHPGGLALYDDNGELQWTIKLERQLPVGRPALDNGTITLATTSGRLLRLQQLDGEIQQQFDLQQPLADGPLLRSGRIVVRAADGAVLIVDGEPSP